MKTNRDLPIERLLRRSPRSEGAPIGDCPDAEALAALADDTLTAAERQIVEAHVADCDRCQAMTAALVRTAIPPVTGDARAASPWWKSRHSLNWLVPAAAAATALALWVAVPGQRSPVPDAPQVEAPTPAAPPPAAAGPTTREAFQPPPETRADNLAPLDKQAPLDGAAAALGSTTSADARIAAPAAQVPERDQDRLARQEAATPDQPPVAAEPLRSLAGASAASARAAAPAPAGFDVLSPDPMIRWRIGPGAVVQSSVDGGVMWRAQETGSSAPLTAGSSPSPSVSWLVGRAGTVLRTVDGGRQWQRVAFPEAADLVAVRASNALAATVDTADGRSLSTTDGGQAWALVQK